MEGRKLPNAGVLVPPPVIFIVAYFGGWLLEAYVRRLRLAPVEPVPSALRLTGEVFIILGAIFALWAALSFRRAHTSVLPFRAASALVVEGPYRFSRNPMYVGLAAIYAGLALATNMGWPLLLLPLALLLTHRLVIRREERYLTDRFGEEYQEYRRRVRTWV